MAFSKTTMFVFFMIVIFRASIAAVYTVGDAKGWRKAGDNFYSNWASGKNFQVGDVLVFQYDPNEHNVLQVNSQDFDSCTTTSPMGTLSSGNDNINIAGLGTYYYICGVPGHCAAGMKFQISVGQSTATPGPPNLNGTPCPPGTQNPGPFQPGGQNQGPFQPGGQVQYPYYLTSASSALSSNWLIARVVGLSAIVALGLSSVMHYKVLFRFNNVEF